MPILSTDLDAGSGVGYTFTANAVAYMIKQNVTLLTGAAGLGIYSPDGITSSRIVNNGTIVSSTGVYVGDSFAQVSNGVTGEIHADQGIRFVDTENGTINNHGNIAGSVRGIIVEQSGRTTVLNTGTISAIYGIEMYNTTEAFIDNSGTVVGDFYSIDLTGTTSARLTNSGLLSGDVWLNSSSSSYLRNGGTIVGNVLLGDGDDQLAGKGGTITGQVSGFAGSDRLRAGADGVAMSGGAGNDILTGGRGDDAFIFDSEFDAVNNVDRILRFQPRADHFELEDFIFAALDEGDLGAGAFKVVTGANSTKGVDASDRIFYHKAKGDLYYDADGSGGADTRHKFAHVAEGTDLSANDFLVI
jgi:Ca2+-binding RTX toxin-like protein